MPGKKLKLSPLKALRQAKTRTARNKKVISNLKFLEKKFKKSLSLKDGAKTKELFQSIQKALDQAAQKKIIKLNNARRKKSRLTKSIQKSLKG